MRMNANCHQHTRNLNVSIKSCLEESQNGGHWTQWTVHKLLWIPPTISHAKILDLVGPTILLILTNIVVPCEIESRVLSQLVRQNLKIGKMAAM